MEDSSNVASDAEMCPFCFQMFPISNLVIHVASHEQESSVDGGLLSDEEVARRIMEQDAKLSALESEQLAQKISKDEQREAFAPLKLVSASAEDEVKLRDAKDEKFHQEFAIKLIEEQKPGQEEVEKDVKVIVLYDIDNSANKEEFVAITEDEWRENIIVYVFGGPSLPNVPVGKLPLLAEMSRNKRLRIIHTPKSGKNAADFALAFYAGILHHKLPIEVPFIIVSKDKGLRHTLFQLRCLGRSSQIVSTNLSLALKTVITSGKVSSDSFIEGKLLKEEDLVDVFASGFSMEQKVVMVMDALNKTKADQRPRNLRRLQNTIASVLKIKGEGEELQKHCQLVVEELAKRNLLLVADGKVQYLFV